MPYHKKPEIKIKNETFKISRNNFFSLSVEYFNASSNIFKSHFTSF